MATFDELFSQHRITAEERRQLVWHLAMMRMENTVRLLLPELGITHPFTDVLRSPPSPRTEEEG